MLYYVYTYIRNGDDDMRLIDLTGKKFNRLTVLERVESKNKKTLWKCKCDCGNITIVETYNLRHGSTKSCGCYYKEQKNKFYQDCITHNKTHTRLYVVWAGMKQRCYCKTSLHYKIYGGRGITICDEWLGCDGFQNFYNWSMKNGYRDTGTKRNKITIDRIDVNKGYSPDNCRWVDYYVQANNKTDNRFIEYNGKVKTITEWCRLLNLNYPVIDHRVRKLGIPLEKAITMPLGKPRVRFNGGDVLLEKFCRDNNIEYKNAIYLLIVKGYNGEQIIDALKAM